MGRLSCDLSRPKHIRLCWRSNMSVDFTKKEACAHCSKEFFKRRQSSQRKQLLSFCSPVCYSAYRSRNTEKRKCKRCGIEFSYQSNRSKEAKNGGQYCSSKCRDEQKNAPLKERFYRFVGKPEDNGCILWKGSKLYSGYGMIRSGKGKEIPAHRASWEIHVGPIPEGMHVLHKCDNPPCVNHKHLFIGTHNDNMQDMIEKERNVIMKGENHGMAKLNEDKVREIRKLNKNGVSRRELQEKFGMSKGGIEGIVNGRSWKHIL